MFGTSGKTAWRVLAAVPFVLLLGIVGIKVTAGDPSSPFNKIPGAQTIYELGDDAPSTGVHAKLPKTKKPSPTASDSASESASASESPSDLPTAATSSAAPKPTKSPTKASGGSTGGSTGGPGGGSTGGSSGGGSTPTSAPTSAPPTSSSPTPLSCEQKYPNQPLKQWQCRNGLID